MASEKQVVLKLEKGTMYLKTEMMGNIVPLEARDIEVYWAPFAQYERALHVEFVRKGARTRKRMVQPYKPSLVVLEGHGHTALNEALKPKGSTFISHDSSWDRTFATALTNYLSGNGGAAKLHDYRHEDVLVRAGQR